MGRSRSGTPSRLDSGARLLLRSRRRHIQTALAPIPPGGSRAAHDGSAHMFKKVLVANRGEIAVRVMRSLASSASAASPSTRRPTAGAARALRRRGLLRRPGGSSRQLSASSTRSSRSPKSLRRRGDPSRLRVLVRERRLRSRLRRGRHRLHRAAPPRHRGDGLEDPGARSDARGGGAPGAGNPDAIEDPEEALAFAEMGFPVLVKAAAGGGGKGMRRVDGPRTLSMPSRARAARR